MTRRAGAHRTAGMLGASSERGPSGYARFALAHQRLREQDEERSAWLAIQAREPDPDEDYVLPCRQCGCERTSTYRLRSMFCHSCGEKGYRPKECPRCGGPTHTVDHSKKSSLDGYCKSCRDRIRVENEF